ncbi:ABC transporter ATP-binding protein [Sinorhizobium mexicanum]|uniref:ABC transporter ATP-binding protein n=1 Tax=Sinorhizobium mexicanum TaxID=375549 RepID=A0A859QTU8_9HYPH|nr:ABC transporter ATP-binding protein [Sinorhizobium mexicanum]MBP1886488.1 peptide/nickel transport system ATP-binding protein [Sinorhizobium mexicanum]QLL63936.1 ABC transporter ATP-binding protein [Sinorhizobium mexicanum]
MLTINNLTTTFQDRATGQYVNACDDVSLTIGEAEIVGLVGESGCGKSTLGRTIVGLERANGGRIDFNGTNLLSVSMMKRRRLGRGIQYVFQDPYSALNPRQTIGQLLDEALIISGESNSAGRVARAKELLSDVGLPHNVIERYARELSGGQRQRVCIARSLVVNPKVLICDEPVSSLDVSIRAQVMNLFLRLRDEKGVSLLFIAHDLAIVRQAASRIYVMYLGKIVEEGPSEQLYATPLHPYTQSLLGAVPDPDPRIERHRGRIILEGDVPSPANPPSGCRFRTRCPARQAICATTPQNVSVRGAQTAACHFAGQIQLKPALVA